MKIDLKSEPWSLIGDSDFVIAEWTAEPGPDWQAPLHRHLECDEAWYVLEGSLGFLIDAETVQANIGELVYVKKGQTHTYWNTSDGVTRYLLFMTAKTRDLIDAIHAAADRSPEALKLLFASYGAELI
jgi:mannose-6-phosphate isomerase-like protein (cupin superfamily)